MPQHTNIRPDDCTSCRNLFAALRANHEGEQTHLTTAALGERCGLKERTVRVHTAHLVAHSRLDLDRRTPLPGAAVQETSDPSAGPGTPLEWVATIAAPDRTCARCLVVLAEHANAAWSGQLGNQQLADAAGVSLRTVERHRKHLIDAGLVRFVADVSPVGDRGHMLRRADRYTLLSGILAAPADYTGTVSWADDRAAEVLAVARWWHGAPQETTRARNAIRIRMENGWPAPALEERLAIDPGRAVVHPLRLLAKLLPGRDEPYGIPAAEHHQAAAPLRLVTCAGTCERVMRAVPGSMCRDCREDAYATAYNHA